VSEADVERRLIEAFADVRATVVENPDLFARVERTIESDAARRRFRIELASGVAAFVVCNVALALSLSDFRNGRVVMSWWVVELITNIVLVAIAIALGPFIKRFGRSYAADVFRANPRTGKSYLVLTDVAYYLIFTSFILFTVRFEEERSWRQSRAELYQHELGRVGGILLVMGLLHTANVVALPVIGNLLGSVRKLGEPGAPHHPAQPTISTPPLGEGTWLLRIEPAPSSAASPEPDSDRQ
jgi:hypothetical protein